MADSTEARAANNLGAVGGLQGVVGYLVPVNNTGSSTEPYSCHPDCVPRGHEFWCNGCAEPCDKKLAVPEYMVPIRVCHVGIYSQTCDCCGKEAHRGIRRKGYFWNLFGKGA